MRSLIVIFLVACAGCQSAPHAASELIAFARIPAETFRNGPTSGQFIKPANRVHPPFKDKQPVEGFSALLRDGDTWLAMPDNGFGTKENSADFVLCVYLLNLDFKTRDNGSGAARPELLFQLRDPDHLAGFPIVADADLYPESDIPVDSRVRSGRLLTGADFDIESCRKAPDDTFWFGDEFGPFLLHTDDTGKLLDPPIPVPGTRSPQNPLLSETLLPTIGESKGIEGLALSHDGNHLFVLLEGPLNSEPDDRRLRMREYSLLSRTWVGSYYYRLDVGSKAGQSIGDCAAIDDTHLLVVERDHGQREAVLFKKVFVVDLAGRDHDGFLPKRPVVDLLDVVDPHHLAGRTGVYRMPFNCIESIEIVDGQTIAVINDNNFPSSTGRRADVPEDSEIAVIRISPRLRVSP